MQTSTGASDNYPSRWADFVQPARPEGLRYIVRYLEDFHNDPSRGLGTPSHLSRIVQENATNSLLLRLPPEIRNKIYEFALPSDKSIMLHGGNELSDKHLRDLKKGYSLSLPQVCRQVYSETAFAVCANNTFLFRAGVDEAYDWFKSRNYAQLNAIRAFRIQLFLKGSVSRKSAVQSQALKDLVNLQWRKVVYSNGDAELQFGDFRAGGWGIERYRRISQIYDSSIEAEPYLMTRYEG